MSFLAQRCRETLVEYEGKEHVRSVRLGRSKNQDLLDRVREVLREFTKAMDEGRPDTTPESLYVALADEIDGVGTHQPPSSGDDANAFVSLSKLWEQDFGSPRTARLFLDKHPEIRQRRPSAQRLEVHAADWFRCVALHKRQPTDAEVEKFQHGVEQGKAKARHKKCK